MQAANPSRWGPRLLTLVLWALSTASATFWLLKWSSQPGPVREVITRSAPLVTPGQQTAVAELLGGRTAGGNSVAIASPATAQANLRLAGVIRIGEKGQGSALIQQADTPAKPYRVGEPVAEGLVLQSVSGHSAQLGAKLGSPALINLELPIKPAQP